MNGYKVIVFDMDGTLYDLNDVISMNYKMQCDFLMKEKNIKLGQAISLFEENHIYSTIQKDSKSCTELFEKLGLDKKKWNIYRENNFDARSINPKNAVSNEIVEKVASQYVLILLTSNSMGNVEAILRHIKIDISLFTLTITSDSNELYGNFSKEKAFRYVIKKYGLEINEIISIGDRFETDIKPCILVGGSGILLYKPKNMKKVFCDLENDWLNTCDEYAYYISENEYKIP